MLDGAPDVACRDALAEWGAPGAVVGVLAGGGTEVRAYGTADRQTGAPMRGDAAFRVASITKPFTATLAVLLAEEGLLTLDEPVPLPLPQPGITLAHLLSHHGGFEGEAGDLARFGDGDDALARAVAELPARRRLVPPGEVWSYCNAGYWAAGLLCARAAGTTYERALAARVLEPLGLSATRFGEPEVRGHVQPDPASPHHEPVPPDPYPRARRPSGGLVSTAADLLRFAAFHLRDARVARMREPLAWTPEGTYGLGWFAERIGGVDVWSHLGSYGGFQTVLALLPAHEAAFTILTNGTGGDVVVREVGDALVEHVAGVRREAVPTVTVEPDGLAALAGRYANANMEATVAAGGPGLVLDLVQIDWSGGRTPLPTLQARPVGRRTFAIAGGRWDGDRFDFVPADGPVRFARLASSLVPRC